MNFLSVLRSDLSSRNLHTDNSHELNEITPAQTALSFAIESDNLFI